MHVQVEGLRFKVPRFASFSGKRSKVQGSTIQEKK